MATRKISPVNQLQDWLTGLEHYCPMAYRTLDLPPNVLLTRLTLLKTKLDGITVALAKIMRGQSDADRAALVDPHRAARYKSEHASWTRGGTTRRVMVNAERVERLAVSALQGLLVDRLQVKQAVLSLGLYSDETRKLLRKGPLACRRVAAMDRPELRSLFLALVPRADVTPTNLTMYVSCFELSRFLGWDGIGTFQKSVLPPARAGDRVHTLRAPAFLICGHPYFAMPLEPCLGEKNEPDPALVDLVRKAAEYRDYVLANRSRTMVELAHNKGMGATQFARFLRLNYLAPDIQAAIIDGTQPTGLGRWHILHGPMPLDWEQQRQLMGFI